MKAPYDLCDYTKFWEGREYEDQAERLALEKFLNKVIKRDRFIDVGGGYGRLCVILCKYFKRGVLVDPSDNNLSKARELLKNADSIEIIKGSLPRLDFKDSEFDLVNMVRVSHHLVNIEPTIKELVRITKPGGFLIIEVANKINILARLKAYLRGDFGFSRRLEVIDRRSEESRRQRMISFVNHHPLKVLEIMKNNGLTIVDILSVSNLRNKMIKNIVPFTMLLGMENKLQSPLARIYAGPSIFILAQKRDT